MAEPKHLGVTNCLQTCPECGYQNGFHVGFRRTAPDAKGNDTAVWLICPSCSALFDIGLRLKPTELPKA